MDNGPPLPQPVDVTTIELPINEQLTSVEFFLTLRHFYCVLMYIAMILLIQYKHEWV